jgi:two-component system chemotaxis response regulator CheB
MSGINVMIVDDSAVVRQVLSGLLNAAPGITVSYAVANPLLAMERMKVQWPDVIVLDVEMPKMDGITFLRKIMSEHPTPVVICSTLTEKGAQTSVEALTPARSPSSPSRAWTSSSSCTTARTNWCRRCGRRPARALASW